MKSKTKNILTTILFVALAVAIGVVVMSLTQKPQNTDADVAKCIGKNSVLYVQLGCHACENQKKIFGDNYQFLNIVDCFYTQDKCIEKNITATPTWVIDGEKYVGVQTSQLLMDLTGCNSTN